MRRERDISGCSRRDVRGRTGVCDAVPFGVGWHVWLRCPVPLDLGLHPNLGLYPRLRCPVPLGLCGGGVDADLG